MQAYFWFAAIAVLAYTWVIAYPTDARSLIAELKRRWRLYLIQRAGERLAQQLWQKFKAGATKQGYGQKLVKEIFQEHKAKTIERLGTKATNVLLGEPTPMERSY